MVKRKKKTPKKSTTKKKPKQKSATYDDFKVFLRDNLDKCDHDSGGGILPDFPPYDLMPQDYLAYAGEALDAPTDANKINCIAHLKRAAECQADTLLHLLSLSKHNKTRNFPSKMNAIACLELMPSRSIAELNRIRNKMEHEYAVPQIDDLTLYFDLVAGFVSALEGAIFMLVSNAELEFWSPADDDPRIRFRIQYIKDTPELNCTMSDGSTEAHYSATPDEWETFLKTLRILFLLIRHGYGMVSAEYVLNELDASSAT